MKFVLKFEEDEVPYGLLAGILDSITEELMRVEIEDLEAISEDFLYSELETFETLRDRLIEEQGNLLQITAVRSGCVIITITVSAILLGILKATVGKTFEDAWKESNMHHRLKDFFLTGIGRRSKAIDEGLRGTRYEDVDDDGYGGPRVFEHYHERTSIEIIETTKHADGSETTYVIRQTNHREVTTYSDAIKKFK